MKSFWHTKDLSFTFKDISFRRFFQIMFPRNSIFIYIILIILFIAPFFFQKWRPGPVLLFATSGDEPHYLLMAYSIAKDHDLRLKNNYKNRDYGQMLKKYLLDHHTYLKSDSKVIPWEDVFKISTNERGEQTRILREEYQNLNLDDYIEIPLHPPGYSILLGTLFYPIFRFDFYAAESIVLFFQLLLFFSSGIYAWKIFGNKRRLLFFILLLSSPVWVLNGTFYTEGIVGSLLLLSLCHIERKAPFLLSIDLFLLVFIKEIYIPAAVLLYLLFFIENQFKRSYLYFSLLPASAVIIYLIKNYLFFGNPVQPYIPYKVNFQILHTLFEILFSPYKGILTFTPHFIFLPAVLYTMFRQNRFRGTVIVLVTALISGITIFHQSWSGGPSFSYRTLAPILFFIFPYFHSWIPENRVIRSIFTALLFISFANMFFAVTNLNSSYASPPLINLIDFKISRLYDRI